MLLTRQETMKFPTPQVIWLLPITKYSSFRMQRKRLVCCWKTDNFMFERSFCGLCGLPGFYSRIMTIHFGEMIAKYKQYAETQLIVIFQAKTKELWNKLESHFKWLRSSVLKAAWNETKVQFLGHIVSDKES